ncbi:hypothetical protein [Fodinibius sp.]|uniref:hypothetical protein n=1 Tax=Fodinibius sp. TaxID=1872440 RepID=UPI002ACEE933|nr:hypothetical protein [Fodinibius sp.]MDZ7660074.1 hypothetical protein [Fodinibius sp.]
MHKKYHIGIFHSFSDLLSYLDDRLIFIGNNHRNACVQIIHDDGKTELKTKEFLTNNNYGLKEKTNLQLEILFSNTNNKWNSNNFDVFFVNTKYNAENIPSIIEDVNSDDVAFTKKSFHFLNSDSYFDYYYKWRNKGKVETSGNPSEPCKMINKNAKPF